MLIPPKERGIDTIQMMVKKQKGIDITLDEAQKMYDEDRNMPSMLLPKYFPGVKEIMQKIKRHAGRRVTGSGQRPLIMRLLQRPPDFLDEVHIVTANDVKRGKPKPGPISHGIAEGRKPETLGRHRGRKCSFGRPPAWQPTFYGSNNSGPLPDEELSNKGCNLLYHQMTEFCR